VRHAFLQHPRHEQILLNAELDLVLVILLFHLAELLREDEVSLKIEAFLGLLLDCLEVSSGVFKLLANQEL